MDTALITGPSSGIGRATAIEMGRRGFHVVAAGRSEERTRPVVDQIVGEGGSARFLQLDLASLESARDAAVEIEAGGHSLQILFNNAGVGGGRGQTRDGFEMQFGVNHLGHFMLTHHLRNVLAAGSRIVVVSSEAHRRSRGIDFERVQGKTRSLIGWEEYATSKLANILFARRLASLRPDVHTYAVHPGVVDTAIFPRFTSLLFRNRLTPEEGAATGVWCATSPETGDQSGGYYSRKKEREPSAVARDDALATALWQWSETWCRIAPHQ
jgi:NAD(P)-dependent dehydrogenase (short-subunit alcohol dehydrogenase family)